MSETASPSLSLRTVHVHTALQPKRQTLSEIVNVTFSASDFSLQFLTILEEAKTR
jgi:hypothetical protein